MCGIVGYIGHRPVVPVLLSGLQQLEYRGYDSAGLAIAHAGELQVAKAAGRVAHLRDRTGELAPAAAGIAHTRWATHGPATETNAHPHLDTSGRIAVVHNGVIDNATPLRADLAGSGTMLVSDTDTEILPHLIAAALEHTFSLEEAVRQSLDQIEGSYGIAVLDRQRPDELVVARYGSPIVLGVGDREMFVASDVSAMVSYTRRVVYLGDGETATIRAHTYEIHTRGGRPTRRAPVQLARQAHDYDLGDCSDYMDKEIREQPAAARRAVQHRLDERFGTVRLEDFRMDAAELRSIRRVTFLGCGSAYYAGMIGAGLVEQLARVPADAEAASEFRYRNPVVEPDTLYVAVSQSGETFDTFSAIEDLHRQGARVAGLVNVVGSAIDRACDSTIYLHAGPEVSVASTKAFTNMALCAALLALAIGRARGLSRADGQRLVAAILALPRQISDILEQGHDISAIAGRYADAEHLFYLGRVGAWPAAREGAQKLKEISYLHAEAYQAAELKHGPLALINPAMPSVVLIPSDHLVSKNLGTIEQIKARGGSVIAVTDTDLPLHVADDVIRIPRTAPELAPILLTIPLQLLAYHVARKLDRDIDKPRNLAKSVTVE